MFSFIPKIWSIWGSWEDNIGFYTFSNFLLWIPEPFVYDGENYHIYYRNQEVISYGVFLREAGNFVSQQSGIYFENHTVSFWGRERENNPFNTSGAVYYYFALT